MNDNAAQFRKEVSVRFTLRASIIEKILRSAFPPPPDVSSPKPSFAIPHIPATVLTSPWAGRQATLSEFAPQTAAGAFSACGAGALHPPFCRQSKWQKLPWMLAVSKMAGAKPEG
ncbi:MAG: hypothetical protein Q3X89_04180 [Faecalibacterium sp.]|nr:hypothetical protein [Faecalibacterium sp.]